MKYPQYTLLSFPFLFSLCVLFLGCSVQKSGTFNLKREQLVNGKDLNDWQIKIRHHALGDNFANTYRVQNSLQSESHPIDFYKAEIVNLKKYADNQAKLKAAKEKLTAEKRIAVQ